MLWGSEVLGFTPTQLQAIRVDAAKATCRPDPRTERSHNHVGPRPGCGGKTRGSGVSTSPTSCAGLGDWSVGGRAGPRHHAGCAARVGGQAQPPQEAVVRRQRRSSHLRAHATAAGLERTVRNASHYPQRHKDRPSQEVRQAARSLGPQCKEQFAHGIVPCPDAILPTGSLERASPVLWHIRPPDGTREGHIFTDGSTSGAVALCGELAGRW